MKNNIDTKKYITVIPTRKYKDINLYLRFSIENKPGMKECIALLCKMIGDVSNKYPTKLEMTKAKDMLYGISLMTSYKVRANILTLSLHYSFINPKFLNTDIDEYISFIKETLYNSIIDDKALTEAKRTLKASILRKIDKPISKTNERFIEIVSKDNPDFSIYSENEKFAKSINTIKLLDLKQTYKEIINHAQLNVYLCGDIESKDVDKLTNFNFTNRKPVKLKTTKIVCKPKKTIVDSKDISQTYLAVVYATPYNKTHPDYFAWFLGNAFFGIMPTSLLFSQVREKLSLCYAISSIDYKNEGLIKVITSIDAKNKDRTIEEINNQLNRIVKADYDPNELETAKTLLCNTLIGTYDDLDALIDYYYESTLSNFNYSIEEYCEKIKKVTVKDLSRVFRKYKPYFNYVLLGTKK